LPLKNGKKEGGKEQKTQCFSANGFGDPPENPAPAMIAVL